MLCTKYVYYPEAMLLGEPTCVDYLLFISFVTDILISYSTVTCGVLFYGIFFTRLYTMTCIGSILNKTWLFQLIFFRRILRDWTGDATRAL
jgi:hypothetical protein